MTLIGCQAENEIQQQTLTKVSISDMKAFSQLNEEAFAHYEEEEALEMFLQAISNAEKQPGMVDIALGDFDLQFEYSDGTKESYHLWIGEAGSTIMKFLDTHTIYTISKEAY